MGAWRAAVVVRGKTFVYAQRSRRTRAIYALRPSPLAGGTQLDESRLVREDHVLARSHERSELHNCSETRRRQAPSPRALTAAFIDQALKASEGVAGLCVAMRGLVAARTAVMTAVAAIDADMRRMTRASAACRRLMTIPGVG